VRRFQRPRLTSSALEGLFENVESELRGGAADVQGGEEHQDVFFGGDEQAVFAASPTSETNVLPNLVKVLPKPIKLTAKRVNFATRAVKFAMRAGSRSWRTLAK